MPHEGFPFLIQGGRKVVIDMNGILPTKIIHVVSYTVQVNIK